MRASCHLAQPENREAYEELVNRSGPSVHREAKTLVGPCREDIEDLEQEVWTRGWRSRCTFTGETEIQLRTWFSRIAKNEATRMITRRVRLREFLDDDSGLGPLMARNRDAAEKSIIEAQEAIGGAIEKLRVKDPAAVWLLYAKYVELRTWDQIITQFGLGTKAQARKAVAEAKRALLRYM